MKQTLEAPFDPGPLQLHGHHLKFTETKQLLSRIYRRKSLSEFYIELQNSDDISVRVVYKMAPSHGFEIKEQVITRGKQQAIYREGMGYSDVMGQVCQANRTFYTQLGKRVERLVMVNRERCFLNISIALEDEGNRQIAQSIRELIHLPGLRGNPERNYSTTAVGSTFPGPFEVYTASVLEYLQRSNDTAVLARIYSDLESLGLTWTAYARKINDASVEIQVGRMPRNSTHADDLVNIADVGFGVSQALPIVVALNIATPGQIVYIEQPEIHLHPQAQVSFAETLWQAVRRGVQVIVETHSRHLLKGLQIISAREKTANQIALIWFERDAKGITNVRKSELDENGAYGDLPIDFDSVELEADLKYIESVEQRL